MTDARAHDALQRVANALGVSPSDFFTQIEPCSSRARAPAAREVAELLEAFEQITDPAVRQECLAFVRARHQEQRDQRA